MLRAWGSDTPIAPPHLKWLDPYAISKPLLPEHNLLEAKFFTARVRPIHSKSSEVNPIPWGPNSAIDA